MLYRTPLKSKNIITIFILAPSVIKMIKLPSPQIQFMTLVSATKFQRFQDSWDQYWDLKTSRQMALVNCNLVSFENESV